MLSPRVQQAVDQLRQLLETLDSGQRLPTVRELRESYGFSISTLNVALDELTREGRIDRRQGSGLYARGRPARDQVVMLFDPVHFYRFGSSPFWSLLIRECERQSREAGLGFQICFLDSAQHDLGKTEFRSPAGLPPNVQADLERGRIHGVLSIGGFHSLTRWVEGLGIPVVSYAGPSRYIIQIDLMGILSEELARLEARGGRSAALFGLSSEDFKVLQNRFPRLLLREHPVEVDEAVVHRCLELAAKWNRADTPDAIFSANDMISAGLLLGLEQAGIRVGADVEFVTLAIEGSPVLLGWEHRTRRMVIRVSLMAKEMLAAVVKLMEGEALEDEPWQSAIRTAAGELLALHPIAVE